jgi:hypothetical protein
MQPIAKEISNVFWRMNIESHMNDSPKNLGKRAIKKNKCCIVSS